MACEKTSDNLKQRVMNIGRGGGSVGKFQLKYIYIYIGLNFSRTSSRTQKYWFYPNKLMSCPKRILYLFRRCYKHWTNEVSWPQKRHYTAWTKSQPCFSSTIYKCSQWHWHWSLWSDIELAEATLPRAMNYQEKIRVTSSSCPIHCSWGHHMPHRCQQLDL